MFLKVDDFLKGNLLKKIKVIYKNQEDLEDFILMSSIFQKDFLGKSDKEEI